MTYNGWLLPLANAERAPRIDTFAEPPRPDELFVICTPADLPASELIIFASFTLFSSSPFNCCVE